jgi:hypothetical protein
MEYQANIEKQLCSNALLLDHDITKELLLGYPFNFSVFQGSRIIGHMRLIPLNGLWLTHLITIKECLLIGSRMLRYAIELTWENKYKRIWSVINKKNEKSLGVLKRVARTMYLKESDYLKDLDENYCLVEYFYA